ncbi:MAG: hypothetical protein GY789_19940 [Hyphomicrobiales bacterium]|nr:hypothetical protein [Hyphomicrobiales bacterium]MCP4999769.1 hypothetical protein [Hyphomicrobiales bacterium]
MPPKISDQSFEDFDAQSEQLSGHDQEYFQLSSGAFSGRFVSAFLGGGVSLHLETASQALEQHVGCPQNVLNIGLVVGGNQPFQANGVTLDGSNMLVTPPGIEIDVISPPDGTILAICIETDRLSEWSDQSGMADPISNLTGRIAIHDAPDLVQSLRGSAMGILKSALTADTADATRGNTISVGERFLSIILAQFSLHRALGTFEMSRRRHCGFSPF